MLRTSIANSLHIAINFYHVEIWDSYDGFFYNLNWMLVSICMLNCHHMEMWISTFLDDSKKNSRVVSPFLPCMSYVPLFQLALYQETKNMIHLWQKNYFYVLYFRWSTKLAKPNKKCGQTTMSYAKIDCLLWKKKYYKTIEKK